VSTLIVQLPPRNPAQAPEDWRLHELPFVLLDRQKKIMRIGRSELAMLPHAAATVLMVAARDVLLLRVNLPPVKGPRLMQALPNLLEDVLIQDAHSCHIAVDKPVGGGVRRTVAALDRKWFRFLLHAFAETGRTRIKAVPVVRCLPPAQAIAPPDTDPTADPAATLAAESTPLVAALLGMDMTVVAHAGGTVATSSAQSTANLPESNPIQLELAIARGELGEGMALQPDSIAATLSALAGAAPLEVYQLSGLPDTAPDLHENLSGAGLHVRDLPFDELARAALQCEFDLCQFEFASHALDQGRASFKRWRIPLALIALILLTALAAVNLEWLMVSRQHAALADQQRALLVATFPKTSVILDPPVQMTHQLQQLRVDAGELAPDDFLSLSSNLARALPPIPPEAIAQLSYKGRSLQITFTPGTNLDDSFSARLHANGLSARQDGTTWIIGSQP